MHHDLRFPEIKSFADLFEVVVTDAEVKADPKIKPASIIHEFKDWLGAMGAPEIPDAKMKIGPYLRFDSNIKGEPYRTCLWVRLKVDVYESLKPKLLGVAHDEMSFRVNIGKDGKALVELKHGQILGSHWLAIVDLATVPDTRVKSEFRVVANARKLSEQGEFTPHEGIVTACTPEEAKDIFREKMKSLIDIQVVQTVYDDEGLAVWGCVFTDGKWVPVCKE